MDRPVDSYRFISGITKRMIKSWISMEQLLTETAPALIRNLMCPDERPNSA